VPLRLPVLGTHGLEIDVELKHSLVHVGGTTVGFSVMRDLRARKELERAVAAARHMRAATELASRITGHHDLSPVLDDVSSTLVAELDAECAWLALLTGDGRPVVRTTRTAPNCRDVTFDPAALIADAVATRANHLDIERGIAVFPLLVRTELVGVMLVSTREALDGSLLESLATVAAVLAAAINDSEVLAAHMQAIRLRDDFLAVAGHELRTPLAALLLQVESVVAGVKRGTFPLDRVVERLSKVQRHADRLAKLINQLLDVSRLADGRFALERESLDLHEVVSEVVERHAGLLEVSGSVLELHVEPVHGEWDRLRVDQLASNLLGNAIKYGAGKPIVLRVTDRGPHATLEVRDHGIGIAADDHGRVFGRFERAVSSTNYAGLGLGLWLVKKIVEEHGGSVGLESVVNEGTTIRVELPKSPP
jgi:signal transduction histidine kinase